MSKIARLLELEKYGNCWGGCGRQTNGWFAAGHDYPFVMTLLEKLVSKGYVDALRDIANEIRQGKDSNCPPDTTKT